MCGVQKIALVFTCLISVANSQETNHCPAFNNDCGGCIANGCALCVETGNCDLLNNLVICNVIHQNISDCPTAPPIKSFEVQETNTGADSSSVVLTDGAATGIAFAVIIPVCVCAFIAWAFFALRRYKYRLSTASQREAMLEEVVSKDGDKIKAEEEKKETKPEDSNKEEEQEQEVEITHGTEEVIQV